MSAAMPTETVKFVVKTPVTVEIILSDGTPLVGALFLRHGERLQDLLNSEGAFLPLRTDDGSLVMVHKAWIALCHLRGVDQGA